MSNPDSRLTFHPFRRLPSEIRLQIWDIVLQTPQFLELRCRRHTPSISPSDYHWHWYSLSPIPALLHVCFESRVEALKIYQAHLLNIRYPKTTHSHHDASRAKQAENEIQNSRNAGMVYMNLERDVAIIHYPNIRNSTDEFNISTANLACADLIHNLGISSYTVGIETLLDIYGMQLFLCPFRNLQILFQIEMTNKENHEQEIRAISNRPSIYSLLKFTYGFGEERRIGERGGLCLVDIGINFRRSSGFWFYALLKKALEQLEIRHDFAVCKIMVLGTEGLVREGGLRPWYCFVEEMRIPDMSDRLLTWYG